MGTILRPGCSTEQKLFALYIRFLRCNYDRNVWQWRSQNSVQSTQYP